MSRLALNNSLSAGIVGTKVQSNKINNTVLVSFSGFHLSRSFRVSVSIISIILPTNLSKFCQKFCAQCRLRTLNKCVQLRP